MICNMLHTWSICICAVWFFFLICIVCFPLVLYFSFHLFYNFECVLIFTFQYLIARVVHLQPMVNVNICNLYIMSVNKKSNTLVWQASMGTTWYTDICNMSNWSIILSGTCILKICQKSNLINKRGNHVFRYL